MNQLRWQPWTPAEGLAAVPHRLPARGRGGRAHRPGLLTALPEHPAHQGRAQRRHVPRPARPARSGWTSRPSNWPPATARWSTRTTRGRRQGPPLRRRLGRLARPADVRRPAGPAPGRATAPAHGPVRHRRPRHDRHPLRRAVPHRLRRGLGAARRRRPAGRRGPRPARLRGPGRRGRRPRRLARGARRAVLGGEPRRGDRGGLVRAARSTSGCTAGSATWWPPPATTSWSPRPNASRTSRRWSGCTAR